MSEQSSTEAEATVTKGEEATADLKDEYTKESEAEETGSLKITKSFGGDVTKEEIEAGAIKIEVKKVDETGKVLGYLNAEGKLVNDKTDLTLGEADGFTTTDEGKTWTKTFEKVETGKYVITETNSTLEGYELVSEQSTTEANATVTKGAEATADLKDEYTKESEAEDTGDLKITKSFGGDVTKEEIEAGAIKITVKKVDEKNGRSSDTLTQKENWSIKRQSLLLVRQTDSLQLTAERPGRRPLKR